METTLGSYARTLSLGMLVPSAICLLSGIFGLLGGSSIALWVVISVSLLGVVGGIKIGGSARRMAGDLTNAIHVLGRSSSGDLNARILDVRASDGIGALQHNINRLLDLAEAFGKEAFADAASELSRQSENLSREVDGFIARIGGR
ncbi:hypothetical protein [Paramagnetospirillum magnetotacticum]|uniref:hypothetical protein n=1 Tax=Paramagnetospirillum magnetotacticum TaxID=188 RepID=UPI001F4025BB|nr:hypothetical protein [Paramagnetospirillum magnetotacticum]